MVAVLLWLFDRIAFLIRLAGADYRQFRAILRAKLLLDNRRHTSTFRSSRRSPRNIFAYTLLFYAFMGIFVGMLLPLTPSPLAALTVVYSFVMVMVGMSLVADFTGVLIDTTDLNILGPRPVSGRTILVARLAHICTYLGLLGLALSAVTLATGSICYHPLFALVYLATLACTVTLVVFCVNVFYLIALRFTDTERFKDLILYSQVAMTLLVVGAYQILPRLMDVKDLAGMTLVGRWWTYLYPPCWFAAPIELIVGDRSPSVWLLATESLLIPLAGLVVVVRYLAPGFGRSLIGLAGAGTGRAMSSAARGLSLRDLCSRCVVRTREQRAGFHLAWNMVSRDRQFKLRAYPQVALLFLFPILMLLLSERGPARVIASLEQSRAYLFPLYLIPWLLIMIVMMAEYSSQFEAAWIYHALPLSHPGELVLGAFKALACRFVLPIFGLLAILLSIAVGVRALADMALALAMTGVITLAVALLACRHLPFSQQTSTLQSSGRFGRNMILLVLPAAAGGIHYLLTSVPHAVPIALIPATIGYGLLTRVYTRLGWPRFGVLASGAS
ncbi:MAG: hypothetical protein ACYSUQ_02975 [Planctomycetota bacterium]|jgi:hypothetical protein